MSQITLWNNTKVCTGSEEARRVVTEGLRKRVPLKPVSSSTCPYKSPSLEQKIAHVLFGSRQTTFGTRPTTLQFSVMIDLIARYTTRGLPISTLSLWGTLKAYGVIEKRQEADILDVLALRRLQQLHEYVRDVYEPGLACLIVPENVLEVAMQAIANPGKNYDDLVYPTGLNCLLKSLKLDHIKIRLESELLELKGISNLEYLDQITHASRVIKDYYVLCERFGWSNLCTVSEEYEELATLDWRGTLPQKQWDFYLERACSELPNASKEVRLNSVCTYFAGSLVRARNRVLMDDTIAGTETGSSIKLAFNCLPEGTPDSFMLGRIELKLKDDKNYKNNCPPWAGYGLFSSSRQDISICGLRTYKQLELEGKFIETVGCVVGDTAISCDVIA